jgi:hypothetical protein
VPYTVFGIGTREYGKRDALPDGSFLTTKFYVLFFIPLWPAETRRIQHEVKGEQEAGGGAKRRRVQRLAFCWPQILRVLALSWGICAGVLLAIVLALGALGFW